MSFIYFYVKYNANDTPGYFATLAFFYFKGKDFYRNTLPFATDNHYWLDTSSGMGGNIAE